MSSALADDSIITRHAGATAEPPLAKIQSEVLRAYQLPAFCE